MKFLYKFMATFLLPMFGFTPSNLVCPVRTNPEEASELTIWTWCVLGFSQKQHPLLRERERENSFSSSVCLLRVLEAQSAMVSGSGLCARLVVVDARHHMLGRLSSIIAKELLNGQRVVCYVSHLQLPCYCFWFRISVSIFLLHMFL